ncbi:MAG: response regulator [Candidatus Acidiferrales bacterium]
MDTTTAVAADSKPKSESSAAQESRAAVERRRRRRAKISAQVHVRAVNSPEPFEEVCTTVDVSRDGLQIAASRAVYWKGQQLSVIFPYSSATSALNQAQPAEVVRVTQVPGGKFSIGIQFVSARAEAHSERKSSAAFDPAAAESHAPGHAQERQQSVVLAVEPDARSAETMRNMLQQDGYAVITVATAQDALDVLKTTVPAVFIAEVESEDMSGHDLCLIIKRNDRLRRVPVILITRSAQPADYSASHELGAVVCMAKPFKPERLQHVVRLVAPPPAMSNSYGAAKYSNGVERAL